jgi:hypothetical protein
VTECEWERCDDPDAMLRLLRGKASDRKLRLFACACCRAIWHLLTAECNRCGVDVAERYADGRATVRDLVAAWDADEVDGPAAWDAGWEATSAVMAAACPEPWPPWDAARDAARAGADAVRDAEGEAAARAALVRQADLLRDLFGSPFRPVFVDPAWLLRNDGAVIRLTTSVYDGNAFDRLPALVDALEKAGCSDPQLLGHLRGPGPHVRGCVAIDALLGRS